jgi:lactoylglutathione lyase
VGARRAPSWDEARLLFERTFRERAVGGEGLAAHGRTVWKAIVRQAPLMRQSIGYVALVVRDYDEAIASFTQTLRFELVEDTPIEGKRWVLVAPPGSRGTCLLLARATTSEQLARVGNQTGGRVSLFLHTDDFWRDYRELRAKGVEFAREPKEESYGTVAVFRDLYGNLWDLLELKVIKKRRCQHRSHRARPHTLDCVHERAAVLGAAA